MMQDEILDDGFGKGMFTRNVEYAGFGNRLLASLIDFLVFLPVVGLSMYNSISLKSLPIALASILVIATYKPLMEYYYGATLGKMAMKLKVVTQNFEEISGEQALIRYFPWLIGNVINLIAMFQLFSHDAFLDAQDFMEMSLAQQEMPLTSWTTLVSLIPIISALIMLFNDKKEAGHDMMAKTYCIRSK